MFACSRRGPLLADRWLGRRPATVSYAPAAGQPPPWIPFRHRRQNDGPPGGLLPMAHRSAVGAHRGSPFPADGAATKRRYRLPASLAAARIRQRQEHHDQKDCFHDFTSPRGLGFTALGTASRCSPAYQPALPPPVSASDRNITIRRIASISHPTCFVRFGFWPASASTLTTSCMSTRHAICKPGPLLAHNQKVVNNLPLCIPHSPTPAQNPQTVHAP